MLSLLEITCLILVGATWGCSNSFLRKGSTEAAATTDASTTTTATTAKDMTQPPKKEQDTVIVTSWIQFITEQMYKFRRISVWLPYVINQSGSILFYITLSQTDLSIAVPACNALSLVFSIFTSWFVLNEPIEKPIPTIIGALLVMVGVAICVQASAADASGNTATG